MKINYATVRIFSCFEMVPCISMKKIDVKQICAILKLTQLTRFSIDFKVVQLIFVHRKL